MKDRATKLKSAFDWHRFKLALLGYFHVVVCSISLYLISVTDNFPGIINFDRAALTVAVLSVAAFSPLVLLFAIGRFSFGYLVGFYFYTMILGYLWLIHFSLLQYDHGLAFGSIALSGVVFLAPAVLITKPLPQPFVMSTRAFHTLPTVILVGSAVIVGIGSIYNLKLVDLSEMYKYRAELALPGFLRYAVWIVSNSLLPFAFACFVVSKRNWQAGITLIVMVLFYPVMLTKMALFAPIWLLFLAFLCKPVEARAATILSFLLPVLFGIVVFFLVNAGVFPYKSGMFIFGTVNSRMIATPSLALEVYNNYFSSHPLTHFCQINLVRSLLGCAYDEPIWAVMAKAYDLGAFNASLFATEGIASVGVLLAPVSALVCGLIIAVGNRLSSGLPPRFVLLSAGLLPHVLMNVPLSTALLTNGAGLLFLLWYIAPRSAFMQTAPTTASEQLQAATASAG